jgi:hypothetical protein
VCTVCFLLATEALYDLSRKYLKDEYLAYKETKQHIKIRQNVIKDRTSLLYSHVEIVFAVSFAWDFGTGRFQSSAK